MKWNTTLVRREFRHGTQHALTLITACIMLALPAYATAQESAPASAQVTGGAATLAPQQERISDDAIFRDHGVYRDTQQRIKLLNDGGRRVADYQLSKAQCWLNVSFHEYSRNDRGNFPQAALTESQRILEALENKQALGNETPLVNDAQKLRPDLWDRLESLKKHHGFQCAEQKTACGEVELVHAGNEIGDAGWRHAKPYIQIAEDLIGNAEAAAASCIPPAAPVAPVIAVAVATPPPAAIQKITLSADALFKFDRSTTADLLPTGRAELNELAAKINTISPVPTRIRLIGHTDRLGTAEYNLPLSQARARTVQMYLQQRGVLLPISTEGHGSQEPVAECSNNENRAALINCLQQNRRVEVIVE